MALNPHPLPDQVQSRLLWLAGAFLALYTASVILAPVVRTRSWAGPFAWQPVACWLVWAAVFWLADRQTRRWLPERDPFLLPSAALLSGWGLLEVCRLAASIGLRQAVWLGAAVALFCLGLRLPADLRFLRRYKYIWLSSGLLLAASTLVFGANPLGYGPRLWLGGGGVYLQPAEPLKLLLIIYLAAYLADRLLLPEKGAAPGKVLLPLLAPTFAMFSLALAIMLAQRDLGTASIFIFLYATLVYLASGNARVVWASLLGMLVAGGVGYVLFDVVQIRVNAWLNPWLDPSGGSFQIIQSLMAIANGGILGRGPGLGSPGLVPVALSDFIYTAIAEETGLLGALGLLVVIGLLAQRGLRLAVNAPGTFRRLLAGGLVAYLAGQSILIIGGNVRLLPLTGVTLPFVSYGGSSLVVSFLALLLLLKISTAAQAEPSAALPIFENERPLVAQHLGLLLGAGLFGLALATGWWAIVRAPALLARTDNARLSIANRMVQRGAILDRNNWVLAQSVGQPGNYTRQVNYPPLSPLLGYSDAYFGRAGLEAALEPYLRGRQGYPEWKVWQQQLIYGQPPPGLNVRLSLDMDVQSVLDAALGDFHGAGVALNANTGEILALASHPAYDANKLEEEWDVLEASADAPLLNRAIQGQYPPGAALGPLLLAAARSQSRSLILPNSLTFPAAAEILTCAVEPVDAAPGQAGEYWAALVTAGCPGAAARLGESLGSQALLELLLETGLYSQPGAATSPFAGGSLAEALPFSSSTAPAVLNDPGAAALGQGASSGQEGGLLVSPLQLALALSPLSAGGKQPAARLALAYQPAPAESQAGEWVVLQQTTQHKVIFSAQTAQTLTAQIAASLPPGQAANLPVWLNLAHLPAAQAGGITTANRGFTWFSGGTLASWQGAPLVVVILLEEDNADAASRIGQAVLQALLNP